MIVLMIVWALIVYFLIDAFRNPYDHDHWQNADLNE